MYFDANVSMYRKLGGDWEKILNTISNTYLGNNPAIPYSFRAISRNGFMQDKDGRYNLDFSSIYPEAVLGEYAYAGGLIWSGKDRQTEMSVSCDSPTKIYADGKLIYKSSIDDEVIPSNCVSFFLDLKEGYTSVFISVRKTVSGFGCIFGTGHSKWCPVDILSPFCERIGQGGFVYSSLANVDLFPDGLDLSNCLSENDTVLQWFPKMEWGDTSSNTFLNIFGYCPRKKAYAWTKVINHFQGGASRLHIKAYDTFKLYKNGALFIEGNAGEYSKEIEAGNHEIIVEATCNNDKWGISVETKGAVFQLPYPVYGTGEQNWLYLGLFNQSENIDINSIASIYKLFKNSDGERLYWRVNMPDTWVRPYLEAIEYGKWNYPLGVTLYGLLNVARIYNRKDIKEYVKGHIKLCTDMYEYSVWDKETYGYPAINNQLTDLNMLDDCGSFGSAMLELHMWEPDDVYLKVAKVIAHHIGCVQERCEDGAFYRNATSGFVKNTMWVDDLYMSTSFLKRYYQVTGEKKYIDDAANQFILFEKYLYMSDKKVMSHIYDFKYDTPNFIPWGRGNGWCAFSLSELLGILPKKHEKYSELEIFFKELCEGYLALQDKNGMWHQVLTNPQSYCETSCTAMFVYAFSRGIQLGILDGEAYRNAVYKGFKAICKYSVDHGGNVHGVCMGSKYSFIEDYYTDELLWSKNDTHGIGIVMLAGIETQKLFDYDRQRK